MKPSKRAAKRVKPYVVDAEPKPTPSSAFTPGDSVEQLSLNFTTEIAAPTKIWLKGKIISRRGEKVVVETIQGRSTVKLPTPNLRKV